MPEGPGSNPSKAENRLHYDREDLTIESVFRQISEMLKGLPLIRGLTCGTFSYFLVFQRYGDNNSEFLMCEHEQ